MHLPKDLGWYARVIITALILEAGLTIPFGVSLSSDLTPKDFQEMAQTLLTANSTLFGLSAVAIGLMVGVLARKDLNKQLLSNIMGLVAVSFLGFFSALFGAFLTLINPVSARANIPISIGCTLTGCVAGSVYLVLCFRDYLTAKEEPK